MFSVLRQAIKFNPSSIIGCQQQLLNSSSVRLNNYQARNMAAKALVIIADGSEEMEAVSESQHVVRFSLQIISNSDLLT